MSVKENGAVASAMGSTSVPPAPSGRSTVTLRVVLGNSTVIGAPTGTLRCESSSLTRKCVASRKKSGGMRLPFRILKRSSGVREVMLELQMVSL